MQTFTFPKGVGVCALTVEENLRYWVKSWGHIRRPIHIGANPLTSSKLASESKIMVDILVLY